MRLAIKIDQVLSEDSTQTLKLLDRRPAEIDDTMTKGGGPGIVLVPANTTDLQVPLGLIADCQYVFIETDFPIIAKLGGTEAARALNLTPRVTMNGAQRIVDVKGKILLITNGVTSLYLSNESLTDVATVLVKLAGV
jgi:hypothetical protein